LNDIIWERSKLKSLQRLKALTFTFADYEPPSAEWDHDHCGGCWATFATFDAPDILHKGYYTTTQISPNPEKESEIIQHAQKSGRKILAKPDAKEWVYPECFEAFRVTLAWKLKS
jgi:hypothetical protein